MKTLRYTLICDGSRDRCLCSVIEWTLTNVPMAESISFEGSVADFRGLPSPPACLADKIIYSLDLFPCDVLFVHRDAEREPLAVRVEEIDKAVRQTTSKYHVPIVPVRMTEAWLLADESAIRCASGNPNGTKQLTMPRLDKLENIPDPKKKLHDLLEIASDKRGRRLEQFRRDINERVQRVANLTSDFSSLRKLSAFRIFEKTTSEVIAKIISQRVQN